MRIAGLHELVPLEAMTVQARRENLIEPRWHELIPQVAVRAPSTGSSAARRGYTGHRGVLRETSVPATGISPRAGHACGEPPAVVGRHRQSGPLRRGGRQGIRVRTALAWQAPLLFHRHVTRETFGSDLMPKRVSAIRNAPRQDQVVARRAVSSGLCWRGTCLRRLLWCRRRPSTGRRIPLLPHVEEPLLLQGGDVPRVEAGKDGVGLDRVDDVHAVDPGHAPARRRAMALAWAALARHRSSRRSASNWAATKRILEVSWVCCLRRYGMSRPGRSA